MREKYSLMQDRSFPNNLIEMKKLAAESSKFRSDEIPPRERDLNYLNKLYKELEKYFKTVGENDIDKELQFSTLDKYWSKLLVAYQDRDRHILEELKKLERLQRLAEKVYREIKQTDASMDTIERRIEDEARRIDRIHPMEAKKIADQIDSDLSITEQNINSIFNDVQQLITGRYPQAYDLEKRTKKLHERWVSLRKLLHRKIIGPLSNVSYPVEERTITKHVRTVQETRSIDTNPHYRSLQEAIEWCKMKLVNILNMLHSNKLILSTNKTY